MPRPDRFGGLGPHETVTAVVAAVDDRADLGGGRLRSPYRDGAVLLLRLTIHLGVGVSYPGRMRVLIIDGANVVGSRPDGWWHDRAGADRRLHGQLSAADWPEDEIVPVLEGDTRRGYGAGEEARVRRFTHKGRGTTRSSTRR